MSSTSTKRPNHSKTNPHLPSDVITLILSKLPVKPLLKFKSVSKPWLSLISSQSFTTTHLINSKKCFPKQCWIMLGFGHKCVWQCSLPLFLEQPIIRPVCGLPLPSHSTKFNIVGSCDGLICIAFLDSNELVLLNPSTKKVKYLPDSGENVISSNCIFGFGFDRSSNDYKVFGFFTKFSTNDCVVKCFSLRSGEWKRMERSVTAFGLDEPPLFVNGKFYWLNKVEFLLLGEMLCCLDLATEVYTKYALPDDVGLGANSLAVSEKQVYLTSFQKSRAFVWIVNEDGVKAVWKNMCSMGYDDFYPEFVLGYSECRFYVLNDEETIVLLFQANVIIINMKDGACSFSEVIGRSNDIVAWVCVESLV